MSELSQSEIDKIVQGLESLRYLKEIMRELSFIRAALEKIEEHFPDIVEIIAEENG